MGPLDGILGQSQPAQSGLFADPNAMLQLAAGLFATRKGDFGGGFGGALSKAGQQLEQDQLQERANRQNDIQQLSGAYNLLKQQESMRMLAAQKSGQPYTPNPMLDQVGSRLSQLLGLGNLGGAQAGQAASAPKATPTLPPAVASQYSPAVNPAWQAQGPMPQAATQPQAAPPPQRSGADMASFGDDAMGVSPEAYYASDPTGKTYLEALIKQNTPLSTRFGVYGLGRDQQLHLRGGMVPQGAMPVNVDASGNSSIGALPGQLNLAQQLAEVGPAAQFKYRAEPVQMADGSTQWKLVSQVAGNPGQSAPPAVPPQPPQPLPPQPAPTQAPPPQPGVAKLTVTQPSQNATQGDPYAWLPKIPTPQGVGQSVISKGLDEQRAVKAKALSDQFGQESEVAGQRIAMNNQALDLVDHADTGWLANNISQFRGVLGSLGVQSAADKAATDQILGKDLISTALTKGKQLFGARFTQSEVGMMLSRASPSPEMQKVAIKFLLQTDNAMQGYNIQRGVDFTDAMAHGGDPLYFSPAYAQHKPLTQALNSVSLGKTVAAAPAGLQLPPGFKYIGPAP